MEKLINIGEYSCLVMSLQCLLQLIHLIAYVVAHLDGLFVGDLEFLPRFILQDRLAGLTRALDFLAPLFMLLDLREED